jgi:hypothetical protein
MRIWLKGCWNRMGRGSLLCLIRRIVYMYIRPVHRCSAILIDLSRPPIHPLPSISEIRTVNSHLISVSADDQYNNDESNNTSITHSLPPRQIRPVLPSIEQGRPTGETIRHDRYALGFMMRTTLRSELDKVRNEAYPRGE